MYALTPNGEVRELPRGSTPIDFAYSIHTEVGDCCSGARVNGQLVSLKYKLQHGDIVEIITQKIRVSNAISGTLYSAGSPVTVDQDVLVSWRTLIEEQQNGDQHGNQVDDLFAATIDHIQYQVRSQVSKASDEELRLANGDIPEWIEVRYLDLPDTVPDRVLQLAQEIVANQPTKYCHKSHALGS